MHCAGGVSNGIFQARGRFAFFQADFVRPSISEIKRIRGCQLFILNLNAVFIQEQHEPLRRINAEMVVALGADVQVVFQLFLPDDLPAAFTLDPEAFRANAFLVGRLDFTGFPFKPSQD
jgi:hypothetical protein